MINGCESYLWTSFIIISFPSCRNSKRSFLLPKANFYICAYDFILRNLALQASHLSLMYLTASSLSQYWNFPIGFFFYVSFLKKLFMHFYWRLITWQYFSGFPYTQISHRCTHVPHPEPPSQLPPIPSLRVIPVHQPWAPCLMHRTWTGDLVHIW